MATNDNDSLGNFAQVESFLDRRVRQFLVKLNRHWINSPQQGDQLTEDQLEKYFKEWLENGSLPN